MNVKEWQLSFFFLASKFVLLFYYVLKGSLLIHLTDIFRCQLSNTCERVEKVWYDIQSQMSKMFVMMNY